MWRRRGGGGPFSSRRIPTFETEIVSCAQSSPETTSPRSPPQYQTVLPSCPVKQHKLGMGSMIEDVMRFVLPGRHSTLLGPRLAPGLAPGRSIELLRIVITTKDGYSARARVKSQFHRNLCEFWSEFVEILQYFENTVLADCTPKFKINVNVWKISTFQKLSDKFKLCVTFKPLTLMPI